ncbi:PH domain-containing protein [Streptomyces sp. NPDC001480]|uniref:PH domain-containing protein n=1 Tax=Streptomyces sp. NPDC001480 TaxID=3364577 RepID=UPI0036AFF09E
MSTSDPQSPLRAPQPASTDFVFRSPAGIATGAVLLTVVLGLGLSAVVSAKGGVPWKALSWLLLLIPLLIAFTLRPAVFANDHRLRIRNPIRTITLPWGAVSRLRAGHSNEVFDQTGTKYQLWAIPVSARGVKRASRERVRMVESSLNPGGPVLDRRGLFDAGRPDRPNAEAERLRPRADRAMESLRALQEAGAMTKEGQGQPQVRWAYEILGPAAAGLVLLVVLLAVV